MFKLPVKFDKGSGMFFDADSNHIADIRGWEYLQYKENPQELQDKMGEDIATAINEYYTKPIFSKEKMQSMASSMDRDEFINTLCNDKDNTVAILKEEVERHYKIYGYEKQHYLKEILERFLNIEVESNEKEEKVEVNVFNPFALYSDSLALSDATKEIMNVITYNFSNSGDFCPKTKDDIDKVRMKWKNIGAMDTASRDAIENFRKQYSELMSGVKNENA